MRWNLLWLGLLLGCSGTSSKKDTNDRGTTPTDPIDTDSDGIVDFRDVEARQHELALVPDLPVIAVEIVMSVHAAHAPIRGARNPRLDFVDVRLEFVDAAGVGAGVDEPHIGGECLLEMRANPIGIRCHETGSRQLQPPNG